MLEVFRKLGSIQFDPIAVAGRNHDLVVHARVAGHSGRFPVSSRRSGGEAHGHASHPTSAADDRHRDLITWVVWDQQG